MFHAILDISLLQSKFIFGTQDHNIIDHGEFICTKLNLQYEDVIGYTIRGTTVS
jgi:hypothetical protein